MKYRSLIAVIAIYALLINVVFGYFLFITMAGSGSSPVATAIKCTMMILITALYVAFMWTHRTEEGGVSFRIFRR